MIANNYSFIHIITGALVCCFKNILLESHLILGSPHQNIGTLSFLNWLKVPVKQIVFLIYFFSSSDTTNTFVSSCELALKWICYPSLFTADYVSIGSYVLALQCNSHSEIFCWCSSINVSDVDCDAKKLISKLLRFIVIYILEVYF